MTRCITILGATGSIGQSTLAVIAEYASIEVFALTANENSKAMAALCLQVRPRYAVMANEEAAKTLKTLLSGSDVETEVLNGNSALEQVAADEEVDTVMAAIVGAAGLPACLAAASAGKKILLANKEALVMAGDLFMAAVAEGNSTLLPIDSEHNAIFQCLPSHFQEQMALPNNAASTDPSKQIRRVLLTASGGPFLDLSLEQLSAVTPAQACQHPNWEMGRKISVDSATMMNKGLEYIEACFLFDLTNENLEVVIHPQSIVHSMVEFVDGSVIAEMASPDMKVPIAQALAWPERMHSGATYLDLCNEPALQFRKPDLQRYPCLGLGMAAAKQRGTAPAVLNAANEVAVAAFLRNEISFNAISSINAEVMEKTPCEATLTTDIILHADGQARLLAKQLINNDNFHRK